MKQICLLAAVCDTLVLPGLASAQTGPAIPPSITTPDKVESRLGTLDFKDGAPGKATLDENKNDPKPAVESIKQSTKIYPYEAGGVGTPIAEFLSGKAKLGKITEPPATVLP